MRLRIRFGIRLELRRIRNTIAKLDWYGSYGYKVRLPKAIDPKNATVKELTAALRREYRAEDYRKAAAEISSGYSSVDQNFTKAVKKRFGKNVPDVIEVILTRYGTGGSYNLPNKVIVNICGKHPAMTLLHEICHLMVEPYVKRHQVPHWEKEKIVDQILGSEKLKP